MDEIVEQLSVEYTERCVATEQLRNETAELKAKLVRHFDERVHSAPPSPLKIILQHKNIFDGFLFGPSEREPSFGPRGGFFVVVVEGMFLSSVCFFASFFIVIFKMSFVFLRQPFLTFEAGAPLLIRLMIELEEV